MVNPLHIDELKELNKLQNDGRGVSCVNSIIYYLERQSYFDALTVIDNEFDKLRNYPAIVQWIKTNIPS
ncbi:MAG: hypothetical protein JWP44_5110 [Mucilaginibacter sp.]|nr:hypothetical protein [Mucilaginibacter sp.]